MSERRVYGAWAGRPDGEPEDVTRCIASVTPNERGGFIHRHQCFRKRGFGEGGLYCKQHDPEVSRAREDASRARQDAAWEKQVLESCGPRFFKALCQIADGHNDPRSLAQETIKGLSRPTPTEEETGK